MKWINDDILLIVLLSSGLPILLIAIFTTGINIGSDPVLLTLFVIAAILFVSLIIIRRKKKRNRKV